MKNFSDARDFFQVYTESVSEILQLPNDALLNKTRQVAERVREAGGRALLVGGYVRDALLNLSPKDADLEVYGLEAEVLRKVLQRCGRVGCVGESFRVYKLSWHENDERFELDVSLPRRDKKVGQGHRGFEVEGDPHASFEDAARRRDFTVNAIMCDPLTGEIIDPFGGRNDLNNRVLKMVDAEHFAEDSLRVLRACQFAARFRMMIDPATAELCQAVDLSDLPRERVWSEWEKLLLKAEQPSLGLRFSSHLRVLEKLFPYLESLMQQQAAELCGRLDDAVREIDKWPIEKKMQGAPLAPAKRLALLLAVICVFLESSDRTCFLEDLNIHSTNGYALRDNTLSLAQHYLAPVELWNRGQNGEFVIGEIRRLSAHCELRLLFHITRTFGNAQAAAWILHKFRELGVENGAPQPLLLGRHLLEMGLKPGPRIGEITRAVYEKQLDGDVNTLEEAKAIAQKLIDENE